MFSFLFIVALSTLPFWLIGILFFYCLYWKIRNFLGDHVSEKFYDKEKRQLIYALDNFDEDLMKLNIQLEQKGLSPVKASAKDKTKIELEFDPDKATNDDDSINWDYLLSPWAKQALGDDINDL